MRRIRSEPGQGPTLRVDHRCRGGRRKARRLLCPGRKTFSPALSGARPDIDGGRRPTLPGIPCRSVHSLLSVRGAFSAALR